VAAAVRTMAASQSRDFHVRGHVGRPRPLGWDVYESMWWPSDGRAPLGLVPMTPANSSRRRRAHAMAHDGPRLRFVDPRLYEGVRTTTRRRRTPRLLFTAGACPSTRGQTVAPGNVSARPPSGHQPVRTLRRLGHRPPSCCTHAVRRSSRRGDLVSAWDVLHDRFGEKAPPSTLLGVRARYPSNSSRSRLSPSLPAGLKYQASGHEQRRAEASSVSGMTTTTDPGWFGVRCVFRTSDRRPTRSASLVAGELPRHAIEQAEAEASPTAGWSRASTCASPRRTGSAPSSRRVARRSSRSCVRATSTPTTTRQLLRHRPRAQRMSE